MENRLRPNPVVRTLLVRDLLPFLPVWLFGVVLAAALDYFDLIGPRLPLGDIDHFAGYYTVLVAGMASVNFVRHYRSAPRAIQIDEGGLRVSFMAASPTEDDEAVPFEQVRSVYLSGFFGPHLEAVLSRSGWRSMPLTPDNARSVAAAWTAWRVRASGASGGGG